MRVHTTAVPATKHLPVRIHVKLTDDQNAPNNIKDFTYAVNDFSDPEHDYCANKFVGTVIGMKNAYVEKVSETLTNRGYIYKIVENV